MLTYGFLCLAVISLTQAVTIRPENTLNGPYIGDSDNLFFWDITGSAQLEGGHIRLTPDEPNKHGAVWNNFPSLSNNWEYQVLFHIHGKGVHLYGDGMALWYVRESDMLHHGPVFGSKDYFCGLGIFIDTFENKQEHDKLQRHPYISAMVNNGSLHYEHEEDGVMTQIGGCHAAVRNLEVPTKIAISYMNDILAVYIDNQGLGQWVLCLRAEGVHLPTGYHFGISASTRDVSDNHDVIAVTSLNMDPSDVELNKDNFLPSAENIQVPLKYRKEFIEEELQKIEKREAKDEVEDDDSQEDDDDDDEEEEEGGKEESKPQKTDQEKKESSEKKEVDPPRTSVWRKLLYITGSTILLMIGVSMFKKYNERRKERMQKRLF